MTEAVEKKKEIEENDHAPLPSDRCYPPLYKALGGCTQRPWTPSVLTFAALAKPVPLSPDCTLLVMASSEQQPLQPNSLETSGGALHT